MTASTTHREERAYRSAGLAVPGQTPRAYGRTARQRRQTGLWDTRSPNLAGYYDPVRGKRPPVRTQLKCERPARRSRWRGAGGRISGPRLARVTRAAHPHRRTGSGAARAPTWWPAGRAAPNLRRGRLTSCRDLRVGYTAGRARRATPGECSRPRTPAATRATLRSGPLRQGTVDEQPQATPGRHRTTARHERPGTHGGRGARMRRDDAGTDGGAATAAGRTHRPTGDTGGSTSRPAPTGGPPEPRPSTPPAGGASRRARTKRPAGPPAAAPARPGQTRQHAAHARPHAPRKGRSPAGAPPDGPGASRRGRPRPAATPNGAQRTPRRRPSGPALAPATRDSTTSPVEPEKV